MTTKAKGQRLKAEEIVRMSRHALPLMGAEARREVEAICNKLENAEHRTSNADPENAYTKRAAAAWESDMQPVGTSLAAALHAGGSEALAGFRRLLPGMMKEVNRAPAMTPVLAEAMAHAFYSRFHLDHPEAALATPNATIGGVTFSEEPVVTEAMARFREREVMETDRSSDELRGLAREISDRSLFSARTTNAEYLRDVQHVVDEILSGNMGMSEGRWRLMKKLKELGYDPAVGFPEDYGAVPPAERGSLQDLSSERRIDLLLETNVRMAQGYAQVVGGNTETARYGNPAWELVRLYHRDVPRGTPESHSVGWQRRWTDAGESVQWDGALQGRLLARKDSPIWQALGDGEGGYVDTLLNPFPPFAFRSGMAWRAVPREEAVSLGLVSSGEIPAPTQATLTPGQQEVMRIVDAMPADWRAELARELEAIG